MTMTDIPASISKTELQELAAKATREKTILDPHKMRHEVTLLVEALELMVRHAETFNVSDIYMERAHRFITARRSLKIALRNLRKSIET